LFPDRIDLGVGRAAVPAEIEQALNRSGSAAGGQDDPMAAAGAWLRDQDQIEELLAWLRFPTDPENPYEEIAPGVAGGPAPWVLGSSPNSALFAAHLGLPYCFAGFIKPSAASTAIQIYNAAFTASDFADQPYSMLSLDISCAGDDLEARELRASAELVRRDLARGLVRSGPLPSPEQALAQLGVTPAPTPVRSAQLPHQISGTPEHLADVLDEILAQTGVDEILAHDSIGDPDCRMASYGLLSSLITDQPTLNAPVSASASGSSR
ncbi:MAG: LLM class flavin-dependent oxidoreductase, partial [Mycobacterium sp.]